MAYNLSLTTKNYIFSNIVPKLNFQQIQDGIGFTDSFFNYNKHHILIRVFKSTWINNPNQNAVEIRLENLSIPEWRVNYHIEESLLINKKFFPECWGGGDTTTNRLVDF